MDSLIEQLYKRKKTPKDAFIQTLLLIAILLIAAAMLIIPRFFLSGMLLSLVSVLLCIGVLYFGYKLYMRFDLEFEYTYLNGEIDIDKIMSKSIRKRIVTVDSRTFEQFGEFDKHIEERAKEMSFDTKIDLSSNTDAKRYYATLKHKDHGRTLLIFEPEERILEDMKKYIKNAGKL